MNQNSINEVPNELTIPTMIEIMENKDKVTLDHSSRVQMFANIIANGLLEAEDKYRIKKKDIPNLWTAAIIHDIGKIFITDEILGSDKKLTKDEFDKMKFHPLRGYNFAKQLDLPEEILHAVLYHHERWDGKIKGCRYPGYPYGLKGFEIPLFARIIKIADAFDSIIYGRPYKKPAAIKKSLTILRGSSGKQFDPYLVKIFINQLRPKEIVHKICKIVDRLPEN